MKNKTGKRELFLIHANPRQSNQSPFISWRNQKYEVLINNQTAAGHNLSHKDTLTRIFLFYIYFIFNRILLQHKSITFFFVLYFYLFYISYLPSITTTPKTLQFLSFSVHVYRFNKVTIISNS